MKVTFISPNYSNIWEPIGLGYIISYIKKNFKGKLDINFFHDNFDLIEDIIKIASTSDIVGISSTSPTYSRACEIANLIKSVGKPHIVLGGWHPSTLSIHAYQLSNIFDQIVLGEGEQAFLSILEGNRNWVLAGTRLLFQDLPWPDRKLINERRHLDYCEDGWRERIASIQSVRGCKRNCAMCGEYFMSCNQIRIRNCSDTLDEIEDLQKEYNIDRIKFLDPTWAISEKYVIEFCTEKLKRNNTIKWDAMVHASYATEKSIEMMAKANCDVIMVGCESGNQKTLNSIGKGTTLKKIKKVFGWGKQYNINRRAFFVLGFPDDTLNDIDKIRQLIYDIDPDIVGFTILAPYPGTRYFDYDKYRNIDWSTVDEYSNNIWYTDNFTNEELKKIQMQLANEFKDKIPYHMKEIIGV